MSPTFTLHDNFWLWIPWSWLISYNTQGFTYTIQVEVEISLHGQGMVDMDSWLPYIDITLISNVHIVHVGLENIITGCSNLVHGVYEILKPKGFRGERTPLNWWSWQCVETRFVRFQLLIGDMGFNRGMCIDSVWSSSYAQSIVWLWTLHIHNILWQ